jgi:hypothetical protein
MLPEARQAFIGRFLEVVLPVYPDIRDVVRFAAIGSGASYNWDEAGDFDVQVWVANDDLVAEIRRLIVAELLDKTCEDFGLDGTMGVQYYAKLGRGIFEENLSGNPYACYDIDLDKWLVEPFPMTPEFYGDLFLLVTSRAEEIAQEADILLSAYERDRRDVEYWSALAAEADGYEYQVEASQANLRESWDRAKAFFHQMMLMRKRAYEPGGKGVFDDGDAIWKLLEVWGITPRLKTLAHGEPGVVV